MKRIWDFHVGTWNLTCISWSWSWDHSEARTSRKPSPSFTAHLLFRKLAIQNEHPSVQCTHPVELTDNLRVTIDVAGNWQPGQDRPKYACRLAKIMISKYLKTQAADNQREYDYRFWIVIFQSNLWYQKVLATRSKWTRTKLRIFLDI